MAWSGIMRRAGFIQVAEGVVVIAEIVSVTSIIPRIKDEFQAGIIDIIPLVFW